MAIAADAWTRTSSSRSGSSAPGSTGAGSPRCELGRCEPGRPGSVRFEAAPSKAAPSKAAPSEAAPLEAARVEPGRSAPGRSGPVCSGAVRLELESPPALAAEGSGTSDRCGSALCVDGGTLVILVDGVARRWRLSAGGVFCVCVTGVCVTGVVSGSGAVGGAGWDPHRFPATVWEVRPPRAGRQAGPGRSSGRCSLAGVDAARPKRVEPARGRMISGPVGLARPTGPGSGRPPGGHRFSRPGRTTVRVGPAPPPGRPRHRAGGPAGRDGQAKTGAPAGTTNRNSAPPPGARPTVMLPPWASMSARAM